MRRRPAGGRLLGERTQITSYVRLELDLITQLVHELERVVEKSFIHGDQRWGKSGRITAREGMIVVRCREDEYVFVIGPLNRPQELLAAVHGLQTLLGHSQRQVDDFAFPDVDRPINRLDDDFDLAAP